MNRPSLIQGILVALVLSIIAPPFAFFIGSIFHSGFTLRLMVGLITYLYVLYLLSRSNTKVGRGTVSILSALALLGGAVLALHPFEYVLLAVAVIWCVRSLYAYSSILSAMSDGVLCCFSLGCSIGAYLLCHNIFVAIWCFFLTQALFVFIPRRFAFQPGASRLKPGTKPKIDPFMRAHKAAEGALREMASI